MAAKSHTPHQASPDGDFCIFPLQNLEVSTFLPIFANKNKLHLEKSFAYQTSMKNRDIICLWRRHLPFFFRQGFGRLFSSFDSTVYKEYGEPQEMSDVYSEWTKDINESQDERIHAIESYCGRASGPINKYLRGLSESCPWEDTLNTIQALFSTSPCLPCQTVLYRAIPYYVLEDILVDMETQGFFHDKGFLSTSLNLNGISNISEDTLRPLRYVLKLYVPEGIHALYIEDIKRDSMGRGELEVILPRNAKIRMVRPPYRAKKYDYWIFESILSY